jgi:hypothetical protein
LESDQKESKSEISSKKELDNRIYMNIIKIIIFIIFFIQFCVIMVVAIRGCSQYHNDSIIKMIKRDQSVVNAEITFNDGYFLDCDFTIKILFDDGGSMVVTDVNERGKGVNGKPIIIRSVNDFYFRFFQKSGQDIDGFHELEVISAIIGEELETVTDIVKNYSKISKLMEQGTNLSDYRQDDNEIYRKTCYRVIVDNFYSSIVTFDGQEYILLKYSVSTSWPVATSAELSEVEEYLKSSLKEVYTEELTN